MSLRGLRGHHTSVNDVPVFPGAGTFLPRGNFATVFNNSMKVAQSLDMSSEEIAQQKNDLHRLLDNPYEWRLQQTMAMQLTSSTVKNSTGSEGFSSNMTFEADHNNDMLSHVTLISTFPGLHTATDRDDGVNYPVWYNLAYPLLEQDTEAVEKSSMGHHAAWMSQVYGAPAEYEVPETTDCSPPTQAFATYITAVGVYVYESIAACAGSVTFERFVAPAIVALDALFGDPTDLRVESWGAHQDIVQTIAASALTQTFYVTVPFSFSRAPSLAYPLVSSLFSALKIDVRTAETKHLIVRSARNVTPVTGSKNQKLRNDDLAVYMRSEMVLFDDALRKDLMEDDYDKLATVVTVDHHSFDVNGNQEQSVAVTNNGFCLAIIILVQRTAALELNLSNYYGGLFGMDAITQVRVNLGSTRYLEAEARSLRLVTPDICQGAHVPHMPVYLVSFALDPMGETVYGGINAFLVTSIALQITFQPGLNGEIMSVWAFSLNATILNFSGSAMKQMYARGI